MFTSKDLAPPSNATPIAAAKRGAHTGAPPAIISSGVVVTGTLTSTGDIQIDGRVDGEVRCVSLVIGQNAQIHGEIDAVEVTIRGHVKGRIRASKVVLCATSHIEGEILHEAIAVEAGAFFEGNCRHFEKPLANAAKETAQIKSAAPIPAASSPYIASIPAPADEDTLHPVSSYSATSLASGPSQLKTGDWQRT
jgi:cytoskeletal protein CcmA (bactofilin family)